jgi:hypothetical protein
MIYNILMKAQQQRGSLGISVVVTRIWGMSVHTHAHTPNPAPFHGNPEEPKKSFEMGNTLIP